MKPSRTSGLGPRRRDDVAVWRVGRGVIAGLVCGTGALVAHVVAGGHATPGAAMFVSVVAVLLCVGLARSMLSLPRLLAITVVVQAICHGVFAASAAAGGGPGSSDSMPGMPGMPGMDSSGGLWPMLLGHLLVAGLTAAAARGGEQALVDLAREVLGRFLPSPPRLVLPSARRPAAHTIDARLLPSSQRAVTPASNRGPPAGRILVIALP